MPFFNKNVRRIYLRILIVISCFAIVAWSAYQVWLHKVHTVIPDQVYRSAQLSPPLLAHYLKTKGIKSVINLRGSQPRTKWYRQEVALTEQMDVNHYDISLPSHTIPNKEKLQLLVYTLIHAPKPILVHCLGGADRTGLASAVALILDNNATLQQSKHQISALHLVFSPTSVGKLVFPYYHTWLVKNHLPHNRENFLKWVCSEHPFNHQAPPAKANEVKNLLCPHLRLTQTAQD